MKTSKTRRLCVVTGLATLLAGAAAAHAPYPHQPIRFVVPYPAGGATDTLARTVAQKLREAWGQPVLVENMVGASGTIRNSFVAKAPAEGYTVLVGITGLIPQQSLSLDLLHVPYNGAAPLMNLVGNQVPSAFIDSASARRQLKSIGPLAVTDTQRMPDLPDVPTFKELGYHSFDPYGLVWRVRATCRTGAGDAEALRRSQPHPAAARGDGAHRRARPAGGRHQSRRGPEAAANERRRLRQDHQGR